MVLVLPIAAAAALIAVGTIDSASFFGLSAVGAGLYFIAVAFYQATQVASLFLGSKRSGFALGDEVIRGRLAGTEFTVPLDGLSDARLERWNAAFSRTLKVRGISITRPPGFLHLALGWMLPVSRVDGDSLLLFEAECPTVFDLCNRAAAGGGAAASANE